jgi:hypothetical protein
MKPNSLRRWARHRIQARLIGGLVVSNCMDQLKVTDRVGNLTYEACDDFIPLTEPAPQPSSTASRAGRQLSPSPLRGVGPALPLTSSHPAQSLAEPETLGAELLDRCVAV